MESVSASAATIRSLSQIPISELVNQSINSNSTNNLSQQSSPRSNLSALPSPPDSPSESGSVSSLPSVTSSFFFSSAAASPPHSSQSQQPQQQPDSSNHSLIIPSLTLPSALPRPTPFGQTLGDLRLLVLGSQGAIGHTLISGILIEDNEDVVEVGSWDAIDHGALLRASTDWIEHYDAHGLEKYEPTRNVEILEVPGYEHADDVQELVQSLTDLIHGPFHAVAEVLDPRRQSSALLANLLSSPSLPFYTALIFLLPSSPSLLEQLVIDQLGPLIPIIALARPPQHIRSLPSGVHTKLSSFRPTSTITLRTGLFRSPETLAMLRSEAADRFLRWREVERTVGEINRMRMGRREELDNNNNAPEDGTTSSSTQKTKEKEKWSKAKWEAEWEANLSRDVARRLRENTVTTMMDDGPPYALLGSPSRVAASPPSYDPLHLPSLFVFSMSLFGPLTGRIARSIEDFLDTAKLKDYHVGLALLGGFCVGVGFGMFVR